MFTARTFTASPSNISVTEPKAAELNRLLEKGDHEFCQAFLEMQGNVYQMSLEPHGCRVVQKALQRAKLISCHIGGKIDARRAILAEFHGHVLEMIGSRHGNLTLLEVIRQIPSTMTIFVVEEISNVVGEVSRHPFGCRVVEALIENGCLPSVLMEGLVRNTASLICNEYGIYVLSSILERRCPTYNHQIAEAIRIKTMAHAKAKKGSKVVDRAVVYCDDDDKRAIATDLLSDPEGLMQLAESEGGSFVVKELLMCTTSCGQQGVISSSIGKCRTIGELARAVILAQPDAASRLMSSKSGKKVLGCLQDLQRQRSAVAPESNQIETELTRSGCFVMRASEQLIER
jgi:hypothetical protein